MLVQSNKHLGTSCHGMNINHYLLLSFGDPPTWRVTTPVRCSSEQRWWSHNRRKKSRTFGSPFPWPHWRPFFRHKIAKPAYAKMNKRNNSCIDWTSFENQWAKINTNLNVQRYGSSTSGNDLLNKPEPCNHASGRARVGQFPAFRWRLWLMGKKSNWFSKYSLVLTCRCLCRNWFKTGWVWERIGFSGLDRTLFGKDFFRKRFLFLNVLANKRNSLGKHVHERSVGGTWRSAQQASVPTAFLMQHVRFEKNMRLCRKCWLYMVVCCN